MPQRLIHLAKEYALSLVGVVALGGGAYLFGEYVLRHLAHGVWLSTFVSAISITLLCFGVVIGGGEPIYRLARRENPRLGSHARKQIWKGAFLGAPAVIALLSVSEMDWQSIMLGEHYSAFLRGILFLIGILQYIVTFPVRLLVDVVGIPAVVVMTLAAPVGALMARHWSKPETLDPTLIPVHAAPQGTAMK